MDYYGNNPHQHQQQTSSQPSPTQGPQALTPIRISQQQPIAPSFSPQFNPYRLPYQPQQLSPQPQTSPQPTLSNLQHQQPTQISPQHNNPVGLVGNGLGGGLPTNFGYRPPMNFQIGMGYGLTGGLPPPSPTTPLFGTQQQQQQQQQQQSPSSSQSDPAPHPPGGAIRWPAMVAPAGAGWDAPPTYQQHLQKQQQQPQTPPLNPNTNLNQYYPPPASPTSPNPVPHLITISDVLSHPQRTGSAGSLIQHPQQPQQQQQPSPLSHPQPRPLNSSNPSSPSSGDSMAPANQGMYYYPPTQLLPQQQQSQQPQQPQQLQQQLPFVLAPKNPQQATYVVQQQQGYPSPTGVRYSHENNLKPSHLSPLSEPNGKPMSASSPVLPSPAGFSPQPYHQHRLQWDGDQSPRTQFGKQASTPTMLQDSGGLGGSGVLEGFSKPLPTPPTVAEELRRQSKQQILKGRNRSNSLNSPEAGRRAEDTKPLPLLPPAAPTIPIIRPPEESPHKQQPYGLKRLLSPKQPRVGSIMMHVVRESATIVLPQDKRARKAVFVALIHQISSRQETRAQLSLCRSRLNTKEIRSLCDALSTNTCIVSLDLSQKGLASGETEAISLATWLTTNTTLTWLDVKNNDLGSKAFKAYEEALQRNTVLTRLDIYEASSSNPTKNNLNKERLKSIDRFISQNRNFELYRQSNYSKLELPSRELYEMPVKFTTSFVNTTIIDLSYNHLRSLPHEITTLINLEELNVSYNEIYELPEDLGNLFHLHRMDLQHNKLNRLPLSIKDLSLHTLLLSDNSFITLPVFLAHMHSLRTLTVQGNPLPDLPREIGSSSPALLGYLHELTMGMKTCYKMRVAVLGTPGSGKSTLAALIMNDKKKFPASAKQQQQQDKKELVAEGIEIHEWLHKPADLEEKIEFSVWDFPANNDVSLSTHHFFLGDRVIYLLVFNILDSDQADQIEHWLQSIECTGKGAPVILVATHCDDKQCTEDYIEKTFEGIINRASKFKPIDICFAVSNKMGKGIDGLRDEIIKIALKQTGMPQSFPNAYIRLETHIKKLAQSSLNEGHLSWEEYKKIAISCGLKEESIYSATMLFSEMGLLWFYPDVDSNIIVFQPRWLTKMFAEIVNSMNENVSGSSISKIGERERRQLNQQAILLETELKKIWSAVEYPERTHEFLVGLLEKLEIVYKLDDGKIFVPSLLANERMKKGLNTNIYWPPFDTSVKQISRHYNFEFLPYRFFRRIIVRFLHSLDWQPLDCWVNGALLLKGDIKVLLEVNPSKRSLKVSVRGVQPQKNFSVLIDNIDTLISDWLQVSVQITVPCTHCIAESSYDPFMFTLRTLETAFSNGEAEVLCRGTKSVPISDLAPDVTMSGFDVKWITMGELKMEKEIGIGGHAKVFQATYNGVPVAVKKMLQASAGDIAAPDTLEVFDEFRREASLMSVLKHPNVVGLIGVVMDPFCMVLEFMSLGCLFNFIHDDTKVIDWKHRISISQDIANGMAFLHHFKPPIIHRDLKSPNILLVMKDKQLVAKVADFGLSRKLLLADTLQSKVVDNPIWLAPEIMRKEKYTEKVDVYSFGVILWELLTKENFFGEIGFLAGIEDAVKEGRRPAIPTCEVEDYATLLSECWANDAARRPSFYKVLKRLKLMSTHQAVVTAVAAPTLFQVETEPKVYSGALQTRTSVMYNHPLISSTPKRKVITLYDHYAREENEVSIHIGDIIEVYNDSDEWWEGENLSTGERGWFPPNYVRNYHGNGITSELSPIPRRKQQSPTLTAEEEALLVPPKVEVKPESPKAQELEKLRLNHLQGERESTSGTGGTGGTGGRPRAPSTGNAPIEGATFVKKLGPHSASVQCMCKLNHNVWCATSDGSITLWDVDSYEMVLTQSCHPKKILALLVVDQSVWSASADWTIKIWNLKNGIELRETGELKGHSDEVTCLLEVGKYVWSGSLDKTIRIWNKKTKKFKKNIKLPTGHPAVSMLLHEETIFVGSDRLILRLSEGFKLLDSHEAHNLVIHSLILVDDRLWSCSSDQTIKIWLPKTMECLQTIEGHHTRVFSLVFDGLSVWSGGWDKTIMLWNSKTKEFIRQVEAGRHTDAVSSLLAVSKTPPSSSSSSSSSSAVAAPLSRYIWSCSWDKSICVWTTTAEHTSPRSQCISRTTVVLPTHYSQHHPPSHLTSHPTSHPHPQPPSHHHPLPLHNPPSHRPPSQAPPHPPSHANLPPHPTSHPTSHLQPPGGGPSPGYGIVNPQDLKELINRPRSRTIGL